MPTCRHALRSRFSRSSVRHALTVVAVGVLLASTSIAHAGPDRYQRCDEGRYNAAADYAACQQRVLGDYFRSYATVKDARTLAFFDKFQAARSKCHVTYANTWPVHVGKVIENQPSVCDGPRFLDNGDGTVTDELTGLQWEKKTDDGSVHDKDNLYSWGVDIYGAGETEASDGTAYTQFLATLNSSGSGGCFGGRCDWRLPTLDELQTIVPSSVCTASPCIDQSIFGPMGTDYTAFYWSSTSEIDAFDYAWTVYFGPPADLIFQAAPGTDTVTARPKLNQVSARAVRKLW